MNIKLYTAFSASLLLVCCSVEEPMCPEQVVISSPPPPLYPTTPSTAIVLRKRILPHNREEYYAHFANGREINFTTDTPLHYQVGDVITLPLE